MAGKNDIIAFMLQLCGPGVTEAQPECCRNGTDIAYILDTLGASCIAYLDHTALYRLVCGVVLLHRKSKFTKLN